MASPGVGGSVSAASDVSLNNPTNNDVFIRSGGYWTNIQGSEKYSTTTSGGSEKVHTMNATGASVLNLNYGNTFNVTLTGNATLSVSSVPAVFSCAFTLYLKQNAIGGRTVTWPSGTKWSGGVPTLSTGANAVDIFVLESLDAGVTWYASVVGTNFV